MTNRLGIPAPTVLYSDLYCTYILYTILYGHLAEYNHFLWLVSKLDLVEKHSKY